MSFGCLFTVGDERGMVGQGILIGLELLTLVSGVRCGVGCLLCLLLMLGVPVLGFLLRLGV